jgi:hypothetical protein
MPAGENRGKLADVISVLAITTQEEGERESLKYRLAGHTVRPPLSKAFSYFDVLVLKSNLKVVI